jgi:hypothetical protein
MCGRQQLSDARALSGGAYAACCNEDSKTYLMDMTRSQCLQEFVLPSLDAPGQLFLSPLYSDLIC